MKHYLYGAGRLHHGLCGKGGGDVWLMDVYCRHSVTANQVNGSRQAVPAGAAFVLVGDGWG